MQPNPIDADGQESAGRVRALMTILSDLDDAPLTDHVERYQQVHAELQSALASIDGD